MHTQDLKAFYGSFKRDKQTYKAPLLHSTINDAGNDQNHTEKLELFPISST